MLPSTRMSSYRLEQVIGSKVRANLVQVSVIRHQFVYVDLSSWVMEFHRVL